MKINDANKISSSEVIQSQSPGAPPTPKVLTGVASARDVFESDSSSPLQSLFKTFKQSISENNEDKKNYLQKLEDYNNAAAELSESLEYLVEMSEQLAAQEHGAEEEEKKGPVIIGKADDGAAVKEAFRKDEDPFQLKIVKRN